MEIPGYVLQITSKAGNADCFGDVYDALKAQSLADALWFGWCETEISLPRRLTNKNETEARDSRWDVARIFTKDAELRAQRRGDTRLTLLLTENGLLANQLQGSFNIICSQFQAEPGHRILAGKKPANPVRRNSDALIEVAYPRELDYDVGTVHQDQMLVADVQCYYDNVRRLKFVRYCEIQPKKIGTIGVKLYE